jgi:hypothetical protein
MLKNLEEAPMRVLSSTAVALSIVASASVSFSQKPPEKKAAPAAAAAADALSATPLLLPGGPAAVRMDYLAYDAKNQRVWVPAGNTGNVDVIEAGSGKLTPVAGFTTKELDSPRGKRVVGPSSATVGDGVVYVGNRAGAEVCAIDAKTLQRHSCVTMPSAPDGLAYVATTQEVWITTPRERCITILDVSHSDAPAIKDKVTLEGKPEGYAVDADRGLYYTNLEDKNQTVVIDVKTRKVRATWNPGCGQAEPQGLAIDTGRRLLFVACADHTVALATDDNGAIRGQVNTGDGVDAIDYDAKRGLLYAPSGKAGTLSVIRVEAQGTLRVVATAATAAGARSVIVDGSGTAYVADSAGGRLLVVRPPK